MIWQVYFRIWQQSGLTIRKRIKICTSLKDHQRTTPKGKSLENTKIKRAPNKVRRNTDLP
jgi:curved DNA-binding protein CbpA